MSPRSWPPGASSGSTSVIDALGYRDGFTHMEWFRTSKGEAVFGEIGARPPGARSVETMNYACDIDVFSGWAEAVVHGRLSQPVERRYNTAIIFKRAQGRGRIRAITGLERFLTECYRHVVSVELLPPGTPRRNWKSTLLSDGWVIVRHPPPSDPPRDRRPLRHRRSDVRRVMATRERHSGLLSIWKLVESEVRTPYTSIVVPSLSFDTDELKKIRGVFLFRSGSRLTMSKLSPGRTTATRGR